MNLTHAKGFLVVDIIAGTPTDKAGLRGGYVLSNINGTEIELGGDVILRIDNRTVNTLEDIISYLDTKKVGDIVQLTILRDGRVDNLSVQLGPYQWHRDLLNFQLYHYNHRMTIQIKNNNHNQILLTAY
jgi:S1-C subfamily serine protease